MVLVNTSLHMHHLLMECLLQQIFSNTLLVFIFFPHVNHRNLDRIKNVKSKYIIENIENISKMSTCLIMLPISTRTDLFTTTWPNMSCQAGILLKNPLVERVETKYSKFQQIFVVSITIEVPALSEHNTLIDALSANAAKCAEFKHLSAISFAPMDFVTFVTMSIATGTDAIRSQVNRGKFPKLSSKVYY